MTEYNHGIGLKALVDEYLPKSGNNRGYKVDPMLDPPFYHPSCRGQCVGVSNCLKSQVNRVRLALLYYYFFKGNSIHTKGVRPLRG